MIPPFRKSLLFPHHRSFLANREQWQRQRNDGQREQVQRASASTGENESERASGNVLFSYLSFVFGSGIEPGKMPRGKILAFVVSKVVLFGKNPFLALFHTSLLSSLTSYLLHPPFQRRQWVIILVLYRQRQLPQLLPPIKFNSFV